MLTKKLQNWLFRANGEYVNQGDVMSNIQGGDGMKVLTGTGATTPRTGYVFTAIYAQEDIVISEATAASGYNIAGSMAGFKIPAGALFPIRLSSITLTSGTGAAIEGV